MSESPEVFLLALRDVAEAQCGLSRLATKANINRENLYRMLSKEGNPRLSSLSAVLQGLGLTLHVVPNRSYPASSSGTSASSRHKRSSS